LVSQNLLIYLHDDVRSGRVIIARHTRLRLLRFGLMAIRLTVDDDDARVVVVLALAFLHDVTARARGGNLALTFVLAVALLLLELLCDRANLDKAGCVANLVWSEKCFIHGDVWWRVLIYQYRKVNPLNFGYTYL